MGKEAESGSQLDRSKQNQVDQKATNLTVVTIRKAIVQVMMKQKHNLGRKFDLRVDLTNF